MQQFKQVSLYLAIFFWAMIVGGIVYSHIVYFPAYLTHLPASNQLISGEYGLHDENFWMFIHPVTMALTITTLVLNWRSKQRRTFILITTGIYAFVIFFTAIYFVPELQAFAKSTGTSATVSELFERGQTWQHRSWIRGSFMLTGFIMLLVALQRGNKLKAS
ncbi:MAG TPA: DUF1772 domain-containing protein [Ferruginibacter sp.]|mgnify:CR=1 FL=1|nr:DUF1772 domain-containing protein [Ferruginibacter sp.]